MVLDRCGNLGDVALRQLLHGEHGSLAVAVAARLHSKGLDADGGLLVVAVAAARFHSREVDVAVLGVGTLLLPDLGGGGGGGCYGHEENPWNLLQISLLWSGGEIGKG